MQYHRGHRCCCCMSLNDIKYEYKGRSSGADGKSVNMASSVSSPTAMPSISQSEGERMLDSAARKYLGMTGAEFVRAWELHAFGEDPDSVPGVMRVAGLLPLLD